MAREAKPCPFYGMPCEYVPMAEKVDAAAARIEQLEAEAKMLAKHNERLRAALRDARALVLEEAAKVADEGGSYDAIHIAAAIRALKEGK